MQTLYILAIPYGVVGFAIYIYRIVTRAPPHY